MAGLGPGGLTAKAPTGRPPQEFEAVVVRQLLEDDLDLPPHESQSQAPALKNIRSNHHRLAQALALGDKTQNEIACELGYSVSRISILLNDPAFTDIVEAYKKDMKTLFVDVQDRLNGLTIDALDILKERLDEAAEGFTNNQLLEVLKQTADRSGNGPTSTTKHDHLVTFATSDRIQQIKDKVNGRHNGEIKKIDQTKLLEGKGHSDTLPIPQEVDGITECEFVELSSEVCEEAALERKPGKRNDLRTVGGTETETKESSGGPGG